MQAPSGNPIGVVLKAVFKPLVRLFCWWFRLDLPNGASYFVMPDGFSIAMVFVSPAYLAPLIYLEHVGILAALLLVSPFVLLSVLRVKNGRVIHFKLLLFIPYWITRVPPGSTFELYEAWGDPAPTGVAFSLPPKFGEYLHLGATATAHALSEAMGATLRSQGWVKDPKRPWLLCRQPS